MLVLTVTIVLLLFQLKGNLACMQNDRFLYSWLQLTRAFPLPWLAQVFIALGLPCFIAILLLNITEDWLWGLLTLILHVFMLTYALGRGEFNRYIFAYQEAFANQDKNQISLALGSLDTDYIAPASHELPALAQDARKIFLLCLLKRYMVVLFWYVFLGPVVSLLYRLVSLVYEHYRELRPEDETSLFVLDKAMQLLEWPIARIWGLCFASISSPGAILLVWCEYFLDFKKNTEDFLLNISSVALLPEQVHQDDVPEEAVIEDAIHESNMIQQLFQRSLIVIIVLAFMMSF